MLPWVALGEAAIPGGCALRLMRRGDEFSIRLIGGTSGGELMNSRLSGSEEALATLVWARIGAARRDPHLLIGGLGMGFTLRASQKVAGPQTRITLAELVPEIVAWARGPMAGLHGDSLSDPRLSLVEGDVGALIRAGTSAFDAILLDVDNGPDGLSRPENDALYGEAGLAAARAALRPGGVLAVWSAEPDEGFTRRLRRAGFAVEVARVRADRGRRGARHVVWLATRR